MSGSVNKVVLLGRLGKDPEIVSLNDGNKIVKFSLATSETWKDRNTGERRERTEWHNIVIFNENLGRLLNSICARAIRFISKAPCRPANGRIKTAMTAIPPKLCCRVFG